MKRSRTFSMSWRLFVTALAGTALAAGTSASFNQPAQAGAQTQGAALDVFLSGPGGDRFTLVRSADDGWRLQAGWNADVAVAALGAKPLPAQQSLERPLSVIVDGPTGFTFIYVLDEGWKFVGRVADRAR